MGDTEQGGGSAPEALAADPPGRGAGAPAASELAADLTLGVVSAAPAVVGAVGAVDGVAAAGVAAELAPADAAVELASGLELEELELIEDIELVDDLEGEASPGEAAVGGAWRTRPPPLPRGGVVYHSDLPILSVERDVPTQIIRADKILARAREVKRQEQEAVRTLLFTPDADSVARHVAVTHARRNQRLRQAGLGLALLAVAIMLGSLLALHRDRAGQWLASLGGDGFDEPIATESVEVDTQPLPEEVVDAPPRTKPAVVEAAKPAVVEAAKPAVVEAAKPAVVEAAKPAVVEAAKPAPVVAKTEPAPRVAKAAPVVERRVVDASAKMAMPKAEKAAAKSLAGGTGGRADKPGDRAGEAPVAASAKVVSDVGWLAIDAEPGVAIEIYDVKLGSTPLPKLELDPGPYTVWASKAGFEVFIQDVRISAGKVTPLQVKLVPIPKIGGQVK